MLQITFQQNKVFQSERNIHSHSIHHTCSIHYVSVWSKQLSYTISWKRWSLWNVFWLVQILSSSNSLVKWRRKNNWVLPKFEFCILWDDGSNLLSYMYLWSVYSHEINRESFPFKRGKVKWSWNGLYSQGMILIRINKDLLVWLQLWPT